MRIDDDSGCSPMILNHVKRAVQIPADFVVNTHTISPGFDEDRSVGVRVFDHQMMIEFQLCTAAQGFRDRGTHGEVRYEMPVHDIDMKHLDSGCCRHARTSSAQTEKIRRENGRNDLKHVCLLVTCALSDCCRHVPHGLTSHGCDDSAITPVEHGGNASILPR